MPAAIKELATSRAWGFTSGQMDFVVTGTNDDATALALVAATAPLIRNNLVRKDYSVDPQGDPTETLTWIGKATYSAQGSSGGTEGTPVLSFNTAEEHSTSRSAKRR